MYKKIYLLSLFLFFCLSADSVRFSTDERRTAYQIRMACAYGGTMGVSPVKIDDLNLDESNVADYAAQFTKGLEHDPVTGVLTTQGQQAYKQLLKAIGTGKQSDYNAIARAPGATRKLTCPQGGDMFSLQGKDSALMLAPQAPFSVTTPFGSANILEIYWMAICRDVLFKDYGTGTGTDNDGFGGSLTAHAAAVLQDLGVDYKGPRAGGLVTPATVFRGNFSGTLSGPYISQFLWLTNYRWHIAPLKQYIPAVGPREFGVSWADFVALENGTIPRPSQPSDFGAQRYIITGRDLAHAVHNDGLYESYYTAAFVLMDYNFPASPSLPYNDGSILNEAAFVSLGGPDVLAAVGAVSSEALKAAWANKWRAYRILRPEAYAGLVHQAKSTATNPYGIDVQVLNVHAGIDTLQYVYDHNILQAAIDPTYPPSATQTYLLGQAYPEGSPLHPSFTSGHATVAGACVTIIKAFFDDQALISSYVTPVIPDPADPTQLIALADGSQNTLTVGGELDKLAANVSAGRNFAGIHYRVDADYGMLLGEQVAIAWLKDQARMYNEQTFNGFVFTTFQGQRIRVTASGVTNA